MRFKSVKSKIKHFFPEHKFIAVSIQKKAQYHISSPAGGITESLQRQPFFKRLVKKIDYSGNLVMNHKCFLAVAKIIIAGHSYLQIVKSLTS